MGLARAIAELERRVDADPENRELLQRLAELNQKAGRLTFAADAFARVAGCFEREGFPLKAIALLKQVLVLDPGRRDAHLRLAELHCALELTAEAEAALRQGLEPGVRPADAALAIRVCRRFVAAQPTAPRFHVELAGALLAQRRTEEARAALEAAAALLRPVHEALATFTDELAKDLAAQREALTVSAGLQALRLALRALP